MQYSNKKSDDSYYEYLNSEKGYRFLAGVYSNLHKKNDIEKAMWLLCIEPSLIDGVHICASDSFIDWVVDYAKENGTKEEDPDGDITYTVNGYEITVSSIFDHPIGHYFVIINREINNSFARVAIKNTYHEGFVPTIK